MLKLLNAIIIFFFNFINLIGLIIWIIEINLLYNRFKVKKLTWFPIYFIFFWKILVLNYRVRYVENFVTKKYLFFYQQKIIWIK